MAIILMFARPAIALDPVATLKHGFREVVKLGDPFQVLRLLLRLLYLLACPSLASCTSCTSWPAPALCASPLYLLACPSTLRLPHHFDLRLPRHAPVCAFPPWMCPHHKHSDDTRQQRSCGATGRASSGWTPSTRSSLTPLGPSTTPSRRRLAPSMAPSSSSHWSTRSA